MTLKESTSALDGRLNSGASESDRKLVQLETHLAHLRGQFREPRHLEFSHPPRNVLEMTGSLIPASSKNRAFLKFEEWLLKAYSTVSEIARDSDSQRRVILLKSTISSQQSVLEEIRRKHWSKEKHRLGFFSSGIPRNVTVIDASK